VVEEDDGTIHIFDIYFKFKKYLSNRADVERQYLTGHMD
jgi:hypothetical protein